MKNILSFFFAALLAISSVTPAYAYHDGRHHRYHRGHPIVIVIPR